MKNYLHIITSKFTYWVSHYDPYSTLHFMSGRVVNRRNRASYYSAIAPALLYLRPSMDSSSSRLTRHEMKRTRQLLHALPYLLLPCSRLQAVQLMVPG